MNPTNEEEKKQCYFHFANKFPYLKAHVINESVVQFECAYDKIEEYLQMYSETPSSAVSKKNSIDSSSSNKIFSFGSLNSDSHESDPNSPSILKTQYRNSSELSTISSQNSDYKRLQEAYKKLENNRDYLIKECEYLKEISNRRKSYPSYPTIIDVEDLERIVNKKYAMPQKSMSYARDLKNHNLLSNEYSDLSINRRYSEEINKPDLNPNLFNSPKLKNILNPLKNQEEKRNSAHFPDAFHIPDELTGHSRGHNRQNSDPWKSNSSWICSNCSTKNINMKCSRCQFPMNQFDRL